MLGYIYKTTNILNDKIYIGKSMKHRKNYLGSGVCIKRAIKKYGKENFKVEVICYLPNEEQLDEFEKHIIKLYRKILGRKKLYNLAPGGEGGDPVLASKTFKGKPSWNKGLKCQYITDKNIGNTFAKGKKWSEEAKKKFSDSRKGLMPWNFGIPCSKSTKRKISKTLIGKLVGEKNPFFGRKHTEETRKKISEARKNAKVYI